MNPLGFTEDWYRLGIVAPEQVHEWEKEFETGDDPNPEHFRWGAFRNYLKTHKPDSKQMELLYKLGESDPDTAAGSAMMFAIIERQDCPESLVHRAANCNRSDVAKIARRLLGSRYYADA